MARQMDRGQEEDEELNRRCGTRPAADAPAAADAGWAAKRLLCGGFVPMLAFELLKDTHPSGKNPRVVNYEVVNNGARAVALIKIEFSGGVVGTRHTTAIEWILTPQAHIGARVAADSAPFAVDAAHARLLDDYFRYKLFPRAAELLKRPRAR